MAGIWERISLITRSNVNEILSKFEDPEKMVEQLIIDAKKECAQAKKESLPVFANETRLKKELDELQPTKTGGKAHGFSRGMEPHIKKI